MTRSCGLRIKRFDGYEVKTEGDAFMVAFGRPQMALEWCMACQTELLGATWPDDLLRHEKAAALSSPTGMLLYRGLRVRMGLHCGEPERRDDPVTGRSDYFGGMVNRSTQRFPMKRIRRFLN
jgi:adenylate cyclase